MRADDKRLSTRRYRVTLVQIEQSAAAGAVRALYAALARLEDNDASRKEFERSADQGSAVGMEAGCGLGPARKDNAGADGREAAPAGVALAVANED